MGKTKFNLCGFGWKAIDVRSWTKEMKTWILVVADLFEQMFGGDFLPYYYDKEHGTKVHDRVTCNLLEYCHEYWESQYIGSKEDHVSEEHFCSPGANFSSDIMQSATSQPVPVQPTAPAKQPVLIPQAALTQTPVPTQQPVPTQKPAPMQKLVSKQQPAPTQKPVPVQQPAPTKKPVHMQQPAPMKKAVPAQHPPPTKKSVPSQHPAPTQKPVPAQHPAPTQQPPLKPAKCWYSELVSNTSGSSPKAVVIEDESDCFLESQQTALPAAMAKAKTRGEIAALYSKIPPLATSSSTTLKPVYGKPSSSDPFSVAERPCDSDIQRALKLLNKERKAGKEPTGIEIEGNRQFPERALSVLRRFCMIAKVYRKVSSEAIWLSQMKFSPRDHIQLENALWHNPTTSPIVRFGNKGIDATSFSDLVEE